eukprot:TRINITY_DN14404_c0_g1_i1.p1 TRINITY_DN14404_c0_g1~~TRINITY_DN14404_c0_g1_i1.p1  ORF type:complete len:400 (+),score=55.02 TRINITY_DN14404_c0_g1_i1:73-1272(+)
MCIRDSYKYLAATGHRLAQKCIAEYDKDPSCFILLLSISNMWVNVDTVDTIIVFDNNFLTSNEMQKLKFSTSASQNVMKSDVTIYRLVSKDTIEEKIVDQTTKKAALNISLKEFEKIRTQMLQKLLKHGTRTLFSEQRQSQSNYTEDSIKCLFDWSWNLPKQQSLYDYSECSGEFFPTVSTAESELVTVNYWSDLITEPYPIAASKAIESNHLPDHISKHSEDVRMLNIVENLSNGKIVKIPFTLSEGEIAIAKDDEKFLKKYCIDMEEPLDLRTSLGTILWGFHEINRRDFIGYLMKYGIFHYDWKELYGIIVANSNNSLINKTLEEFTNYGNNFAKAIDELIQNNRHNYKPFFTKPYTVHQVMIRILHLALLKSAYTNFSPFTNFCINSEGTVFSTQ